jgi:hypothetical protein
MKSTFHSLWKVALLGSSQQVLALPVSYDMVVAQLEKHGLVDIRVVIQRPGDNLERGKRQGDKRPHNELLARLA